ncbi:bifunctional 5,10-methylenetetrahydrofolate dehydrogenase/5,10-methenyltetrahydrofolate cyclohydrolase [Thermoproteus tenax]|uniref:Bifunctional protein FolD n=1 Tax=Thermoproteus tenax (strain ATCC 35583 / DSM 2078 / JCM 9277 / NBRC 100435 / Kra 1) TaxID=768679 RepID=G4RLY6_THETK|nr:bifunctional 5,10-methylenetetrahydrofolate dehydrogenase/5,10-methenyltetrahydrofolate cyclohydrolase [Thermoproteus tenax]CCC82581.1 methylenetetrahydrofolate dehydrogenase (NADP+) / methenyltetrahydrofolate cyclohydrolase [Thermoproteus tenax Kra 1]
MADWIRGRPLHEAAKEWARRHVKALEELGLTPTLAILLLNDDPVELETQRRYANLKLRDIKEIGGDAYIYELHDVPPERRTKAALELIERLNVADDVTGIIVQKPLPPWMNESLIFERLSPLKDVDGLTPENKKRLVAGFDLDRDVLPCTPAGILEMLKYYNIDVRGKDVVVVGKGELVGKPLSIMLMQLDATVTVLHALSKDKLYYVRHADIVISAVGRPPEIYKDSPWRLTGDMIKEGAVVIGVGGKVDPATGKWYYDVDEEDVARRASYLTPNVGGVGLATRSRIIRNLIITSYMVAKQVASPRVLGIDAPKLP